MKIPKALPLLVLALVASSGVARARRPRFARAGRAGAIQYSFDSIYTAGPRVRRVKRFYFHRKRCRVVGLYRATAARFRRAVAHIDRVIRTRSFAAVLRRHHRYYRRWERYGGSTGGILGKILRWRRKVVVNSFARTPRFPCHSDKANGHTNAFARLGVGFVLISRAYLRRAGTRDLARTLIHETLHTLGFSHRGLPAWRRRYNNSVPPYVGCVVKRWPARGGEISHRAQARLARFCTTAGAK